MQCLVIRHDTRALSLRDCTRRAVLQGAPLLMGHEPGGYLLLGWRTFSKRLVETVGAVDFLLPGKSDRSPTSLRTSSNAAMMGPGLAA